MRKNLTVRIVVPNVFNAMESVAKGNNVGCVRTVDAPLFGQILSISIYVVEFGSNSGL